MKISSFLVLGLAALVASCAMVYPKGYNPANFAPPTAAEPLPLVVEPVKIAALLQKGGYLIYMRHGLTKYDQIELERNQRNAGTFSLTRCETQRSLSEEGHRSLEASGADFRKVGIPLDKIYSSLYCRAVESAKYFVDEAQAVQELSNEGQVGLNPENKPRTLAFFAKPPAAGKNTYMMAHGGIFWEATGFTVREGHAVVLDPQNLAVIVARIAPSEWAALIPKR
jgi:phosphohistidine phosphatase SixA